MKRTELKMKTPLRASPQAAKPRSKGKPPNHPSYRNKADDLFMSRYRGLPCVVCTTTEGTCGHHIVAKSRSKALRYDDMNILPLCPAHHTMGNDLAPHSQNQMAVERFIEWFRFQLPQRHRWITANERIERKYTYRQAVENLQGGHLAWEVMP